MSEIKVEGFVNRSGDDTQPYGYIDFTDGMRVAYAPLAGEGVDYWGVTFVTEQAYLMRDRELTSEYIDAARSWITDNRMPVAVDFHPVGA